MFYAMRHIHFLWNAAQNLRDSMTWWNVVTDSIPLSEEMESCR